MRTEAGAAERSQQVRDSARAWRRAGFVSDSVLAQSMALYPDDRHRFGMAFRALAFVFTGLSVWALVGLSLLLFTPTESFSFAVLLCLWAGTLLALTEFQQGSLRRADGGAESATAYTAVALGVSGFMALSSSAHEDLGFQTLFLLFLGYTCVMCVLAGWRWGDRLFSAVAALSGYGLLTQMAQGRLLWIAVSLLLIPLCFKAGRNSRLAPSHRAGAPILGVISILALYLAVHIWFFDQRLFESMYSYSNTPPPFRSLSIVATALMPPVLLLLGWRRREPLLLYSGLLLIFASLATIRLYFSVMPLSFALILIGAACLALALGIRRWLRTGPLGERHGFTADPLLDNTNRTEAIRSAITMASFTPAARAHAPSNTFEGGGGAFGGGGATGNF